MAAVDYFLKIEGIDGESTDDKHKGEIEVMSWSWGETNAGTHGSGGGGGTGKVHIEDFHFTKHIDKSTPKLMLACSTGEHLKKAVLVCRKAGKEQQEYLKVTLSDVLISKMETGAGDGQLVPLDEFSLNFGKIEFEYKPQKADGTLDSAVKAGWDVAANKKV